VAAEIAGKDRRKNRGQLLHEVQRDVVRVGLEVIQELRVRRKKIALKLFAQGRQLLRLRDGLPVGNEPPGGSTL